MSRIYTKTGDKGLTSLFDGTRVPKNNIRVETYGTIDELNATLGVAWSFADNRPELQELLEIIERDLFDIGSSLATPQASLNESFLAYLTERIIFFEQHIDDMTAKMPELTRFILPSGGQTGSFLQLARTIARRAERRIIELSQSEDVDPIFIKYLNRLSDLLFTMSRYGNFLDKKNEVIWEKFNASSRTK